MTGDRSAVGAAGGIVVVTDRSGNVIDVLRDDLGLLDASESSCLAELVGPDSAPKLHEFLGATATDGAAVGWDMRVDGRDVDGRDDDTSLLFSAGRLDDRLVVMITGESDRAAHLTGEMLRINNEQVNTYRSHLSDIEPVAMSIEDLDEFTKLNNELANLQRELAKTNRQLAVSNAQKDQFLGMAAHELRSPLGVISTYAQFLDEDLELDEEHQRMVSTIRRTIVTMRQLVDELLDVATIESGRLDLDPVPTDLVELVAEVIERHGPMAHRKSVHLETSTPDMPVSATVDRAKMLQVLDNLVTNAIKFSEVGGTVTVRAITTTGSTPSASLIVADGGIGISEEGAAALFTPFGVSRSRVGTAGERGTGLGLAIVKRIVDGHHGSISVESTPGQGTTFTVQLPD